MNTAEDYEDRKRNKFLDSMLANWDFNPALPEKKKDVYSPFPFNPNNVSKSDLELLGLAPYLAQRIINYRSKGGRFTSPPDLLKIYGMDSLWYARVAGSITLPAYRPDTRTKKVYKKVYSKAVIKSFNLNTADSMQLKSIYGIGTVLAARIIKYRDKLGGFTGKNQLKEIYGLDSSVMLSLANRSFINADFIPRQISVNAPIQQLGKHPYIGYKLAKTIAAYRFQHGNFKKVNELLNIEPIDSGVFQKLRPYLGTNL